jgi:hypothetical protein
MTAAAAAAALACKGSGDDHSKSVQQQAAAHGDGQPPRQLQQQQCRKAACRTAAVEVQSKNTTGRRSIVSDHPRKDACGPTKMFGTLAGLRRLDTLLTAE